MYLKAIYTDAAEPRNYTNNACTTNPFRCLNPSATYASFYRGAGSANALLHIIDTCTANPAGFKQDARAAYTVSVTRISNG